MIDDIDLIVSVAIDYYQNNLSQNEIAKKIHASRPTVSNLIKKAKELGIVKIYIHHPAYDKHKMQSYIQEKYKLNKVIITNEGGDHESNKELVGKACAKYLNTQLPTSKYIGIGWGTTLYHFVEAVSTQNYPEIEFVSLIGGFGIDNVKFHSNHLVYKLSERLNAKPIYFNAPAIAETQEIKEIFIKSKLYSDMLLKTSNLDAIIIGIGNPTESSTYNKFGIINKFEAKELEKDGAVVDILSTFYDENMNEVPSKITNRMIGLPLSQILKAKNRIILASGEEKIAALKTLLKTNIVTTLIIDQTIANNL
ncbi:sugar-binding transcriptional regulator [Aerococcaceae bacterium zg-ZJ1578]|uniref:sugar-binding transcriptional regulator n=1 Tax=Aerococcaceae bacterium zg-252 TaxID=2796928 RepID=UPI001A1A2DFA|nr:sugar-binding transcriptional regulator [Aerococcaceae bacterium zg-1578]MBR7926822.1 sugar-binding transcriptional regulator [Aerococcaceae bacterium zg-ZUI334]